MGKQWKQRLTIFLGFKITADGDCSHEIKSHLLLGRKVMTNLDSVLKSRDITLPTKVHLVKAMVFPGVMYGYESWTSKESWTPKNWCFWVGEVEKTLEGPLNCKIIQPVYPKGDRSVLGVHWKDWWWSWNSNTLTTWCKELSLWKKPWCWERMKVGAGDDRGGGGRMPSPTPWTWVVQALGVGKPGMLQSRGHRVGDDWTTVLNWQLPWWSEKVKSESVKYSVISDSLQPP